MSGVKNFWIPSYARSNSFSTSILNCFVPASDNCRILAFRAPFFFIGKRLVNHSIGKKESVDDIEICKRHCYYEDNCVSVNYDVDTKTCELNNATHRWHDNELKNEDNYLYHGADVRFFLILIIANPPPHISQDCSCSSILFLEFELLFSSSRSGFCSCLSSSLFAFAFLFVFVFVFVFVSLYVFMFDFVFVFVFACSSLSSSCCFFSFATSLNLFLISFSYHFLSLLSLS